MRYFIASAALAASLCSIPAVAATSPIAGLVSTGANLLTGMTDLNYTFAKGVIGTATGTGEHGVVADMSKFPAPNWIANTPTSKWIAPTASAGTTYDPSVDGQYSWTLSFKLDGFDLATASFNGQWAADNGGYVALNGATLLNSQTAYPLGHTKFQSFSASSGFIAGTNKLTFFVTNLHQNGGNPTGLQVNILGSSVTAVPEPETYAMLLAGLGLMGTIARRRKVKQA